MAQQGAARPGRFRFSGPSTLSRTRRARREARRSTLPVYAGNPIVGPASYRRGYADADPNVDGGTLDADLYIDASTASPAIAASSVADLYIDGSLAGVADAAAGTADLYIDGLLAAPAIAASSTADLYIDGLLTGTAESSSAGADLYIDGLLAAPAIAASSTADLYIDASLAGVADAASSGADLYIDASTASTALSASGTADLYIDGSGSSSVTSGSDVDAGALTGQLYLDGLVEFVNVIGGVTPELPSPGSSRVRITGHGSPLLPPAPVKAEATVDLVFDFELAELAVASSAIADLVFDGDTAGRTLELEPLDADLVLDGDTGPVLVYGDSFDAELAALAAFVALELV